MNYSKYSDDELIETYSTMIDYSGKADARILFEIEERGGIESFLRKIEHKKAYNIEVRRILEHLHDLHNTHHDLDFILKAISSKILPSKELHDLIELKFQEYHTKASDRKINHKTIILSFAGFILGSLLGFAFLIIFLLIFQRIVYFPIIGAYIICYWTIKFMTKQSRNNAIVFIACLMATICSVILTFIAASVLFKLVPL